MTDTIKIGNLDISAFKVGSNDCKIYLGDTLLYPQSTPPTPVSSCYEVISTPMTSYTSTAYDSVYSFSDAKWYMKNNLNQYEKYGIYDIVENISSATTYDGKLAIVGTTEYQYSGGSWSVVGTYEDASVTYTIDDTYPSPYVGQELATTFKIPTADIEELGGRLSFNIRTQDGVILRIDIHRYEYMGSQRYNGTVTNDGEYYYFALPSEAPQSIIIDRIQYYDSTPIHLIVSSKQVSVEYAEKETPTSKVYNTVADMEAVSCPTVGINQYGVVGDNVYKFEESEEWVNKAKSSFKFVAKYNDGNANVIECNTSNELSSGGTQPSYLSKNAMTDAYIGDCVTSIGDGAFNECSSLTSINIPSGVTNIGNYAFNVCSSLTSINIPSGVTSIGNYAFHLCDGLTSIDIPDGVKSIGMSAFIGTPWFNTYSADTSHRYGNIIYINDVACIATSTGITYCEFREGTVSIGGACCSNCSKLISITIPNSVTSIGMNAFRYCSSLTSIDIPSGVTSIGGQAFYNCSSLSSITVNAVTPPTLGSSVFNNTNNCPIYVPSQSVSAYKSATNWSTYASRIQAIPT